MRFLKKNFCSSVTHISEQIVDPLLIGPDYSKKNNCGTLTVNYAPRIQKHVVLWHHRQCNDQMLVCNDG